VRIRQDWRVYYATPLFVPFHIPFLVVLIHVCTWSNYWLHYSNYCICIFAVVGSTAVLLYTVLYCGTFLVPVLSVLFEIITAVLSIILKQKSHVFNSAVITFWTLH